MTRRRPSGPKTRRHLLRDAWLIRACAGVHPAQRTIKARDPQVETCERAIREIPNTHPLPENGPVPTRLRCRTGSARRVKHSWDQMGMFVLDIASHRCVVVRRGRIRAAREARGEVSGPPSPMMAPTAGPDRVPPSACGRCRRCASASARSRFPLSGPSQRQCEDPARIRPRRCTVAGLRV